MAEAAINNDNGSVLPVFIRRRSIPGEDQLTCLSMCLAAEKASGKNTILGAQEIRGLWRVYPLTENARQLLLVKGIVIRGVIVTCHATNPFRIKTSLTGRELPVTKLWISDLPISVADEEIENSLAKLDVEIRSDIVRECCRNADNKLTHFQTGRRYVFITRPGRPLDKELEVGLTFTATVYHKEMKQNRNPFCSRCLQNGHSRYMCQNDVVCKVCHRSGHMSKDPECTGPARQESELDSDSEDSTEETQEKIFPPTTSQSSITMIPDSQNLTQTLSQPMFPSSSATDNSMPSPTLTSDQERGRRVIKSKQKQLSISNALQIVRDRSASRSRSASQKRKGDANVAQDAVINSRPNKSAKKSTKKTAEKENDSTTPTTAANNSWDEDRWKDS